VQYRSQFSSSLPASLVRGYVQLAGQVPCAAGTYELFNARSTPWDCCLHGLLRPDPAQYLARSSRQPKTSRCGSSSVTCLRPEPTATCFLPVDSTLMGSGMAGIPMYDPADASSSRTRPATRCAPSPEMPGVHSASRQPGGRCTCTAASRRGSATAPAPVDHPAARAPHGRRASAWRTCPTWQRLAVMARPTAA